MINLETPSAVLTDADWWENKNVVFPIFANLNSLFSLSKKSDTTLRQLKYIQSRRALRDGNIIVMGYHYGTCPRLVHYMEGTSTTRYLPDYPLVRMALSSKRDTRMDSNRIHELKSFEVYPPTLSYPRRAEEKYTVWVINPTSCTVRELSYQLSKILALKQYHECELRDYESTSEI
jgi:hypothetical protein